MEEAAVLWWPGSGEREKGAGDKAYPPGHTIRDPLPSTRPHLLLLPPPPRSPFSCAALLHGDPALNTRAFGARSRPKPQLRGGTTKEQGIELAPGSLLLSPRLPQCF